MFKFTRRQKYVDAAPFMRRIIDRTTTAAAMLVDERNQKRYPRSLPLVLAPWIDHAPVLQQLSFGVTKDMSDTGISVITTREFESDVILSFMLESEITNRILCFRAEPKRKLKLVDGIVEYGFYVAEMLNEHHGDIIKPFSELVAIANRKEKTAGLEHATVAR